MPAKKLRVPVATSMQDMQEHAAEAAKLMKMLSNEHRLLVLCTLMQGEMSVGQLQSVSPLSQSALSQHLAALREAGLVKTRRQSQTIYYSLCGEEATKVITLLHSLYCPELQSR